MIDRRIFLAGVAAGTLCAPAIAATSALREFKVTRGGSDMGTHVLEAMKTENGFEVDINISLRVTVLGITAYRYVMKNREIWQGGQLVSLDSRVYDDGTDEFAKARRETDRLIINGSGFDGSLDGNPVTTSYYATAFLQRKPWISTQTGKPLGVSVQQGSRAGWWDISGDVNTKLGYDNRGEWVGCEFDAGGEPGVYEVTADRGAIGGLWADA